MPLSHFKVGLSDFLSKSQCCNFHSHDTAVLMSFVCHYVTDFQMLWKKFS